MNERRLLHADEPTDEALDTPATEPWRITDDKSLVWAFEPLASAEEERKRDQALYDAAKSRLDAWLAARLDSIDAGTSYLRAEIARYCTENRDRLVHGKTKQVSLPTGTVQWRKTGGRLLVTDKEALAQWCVEEGPDKGLYRVRTEAELTKVQALFKATGVIPPGCEVDPEVESITVKPSMPLLPKETL